MIKQAGFVYVCADLEHSARSRALLERKLAQADLVAHAPRTSSSTADCTRSGSFRSVGSGSCEATPWL
eukprot:2268882-Pleurochrysis_carterae.AAC.4